MVVTDLIFKFKQFKPYKPLYRHVIVSIATVVQQCFAKFTNFFVSTAFVIFFALQND